MTSLEDSIKALEVRKNAIRKQIRKSEYLLKYFPDSKVELHTLENGTNAYVCDSLTVEKSSNYEFFFDKNRNRYVLRFYTKVGSNRIKVFSPYYFYLTNKAILDLLNKVSASTKLDKLPNSVQELIGVTFGNEKDLAADTALLMMNENAMGLAKE